MERDKALESAIGQIEKQFGKGSVMRMGENQTMGIESISTGAMSLDLALGIGGLPRGRIVELYGPESSGKSTLALHVVAEAQRNGGVCAYIDAEHAMDPVYAAAIGVDIDELLISQPDTGEQALEIADMLIRSGAIDVIVVDSVAALTPRAEIEGDMGDTHVGLQARLMSQALRKLTGTLSKSKTIALFINQLREKIGVIYGSNETTPGGRALKFYASVRLDIRRVESIKDGTEIVGNRTRVKVVKNKCVAAGTKVFDPSSGLTHRIEDIVELKHGASVVAVDKAGKFHIRPIIGRMDQGEHEVIGLCLRDGTVLQVTADHKVLTDLGWREAGKLRTGDRVARPRHAIGFGTEMPISAEYARLLGYIIGDGCITDTATSFANVDQTLQVDAKTIAASMGCDTRTSGVQLTFVGRPSEANELTTLAEWAGILGHTAGEKRLPAPLFAPEASADVVGNLLFGIWESIGWISREQSGGVRCGFATVSEQLARQLHWQLLRWGITSSVRTRNPKVQRPNLANSQRIGNKIRCYEVRLAGVENASLFAESLPMWGPKGRLLTAELNSPSVKKHRGSPAAYLPQSATAAVLAHLDSRGITPEFVAALFGNEAGNPRGGMKQLLGSSRLRRDRVQQLASAIESDFLHEILSEDLWYDRVVAVTASEWKRIYDVEVDDLHTFVADDIVVSNCSAPFRTAEFDIMYGKGISREGSILDVAVDLGIVKKSGAWYTYEGEQLGQGRENAKLFLRNSPELVIELDERVRQDGKDVPIDVPLGAGQRDDEPISLGD